MEYLLGPVKYEPLVVTSIEEPAPKYQNEYARQRTIITDFEKNKTLNRKQKDDKITSLYSNKRLLLHNLKTKYHTWDARYFLNKCTVQPRVTCSDSVSLEVFYNDSALLDTNGEWLYAIFEHIQRASQHTLHITNVEEIIFKNYKLDFDTSKPGLARLNACVQDINRDLSLSHGHGLMDLIMSFSGLHPRLPDLFYPDEIKVLSSV